MKNENLLIALGGATGSGKTALAVELVKLFPRLVILSADSRQIYKKLDVGTAKVGSAGSESSLTEKSEPVWFIDDIPQYLLDIAEPGKDFTLTDYQKEAYRLIQACWQQERIPFLVGGTGLYLQAIVEGYTPEGAPDYSLRQELDLLPIETLWEKLSHLGGTIVETDRQNKRRVIRAIERALKQSSGFEKRPITNKTAVFVLQRDWEEQRELAPAMVDERLELGLIEETKQLMASGINKEWLRTMGLSYRLVIQMLDGEYSKDQLGEKMIQEFRQLMRRQRTWFNRMPEAIKGSKEEIIENITALLKNEVRLHQ